MIKAHTFIFKILYPYRYHQLGQLISVFFISIGANIKPYLVKMLIDDAIKNQNNITFVITLYLLSDLIRTAGWLLNDSCGFMLQPRISTDIISYFTQKISTYKYSFFQDTQSGALTSKLNDIFTQVPALLNTIYNHFISLGLGILITLYFLFDVHFIFAFIQFLLCTLCLSLIFISNQKVAPLTKNYAESKSKLWSHISDYFSNFLNVRSFGTEKYEDQQLKNHNENFIRYAGIQHKYLLKFYTSFDLLYGVYMISCIYLAIQLRAKNQISPGDVVLVITLNLQMIERLYGVSHQLREFIIKWNGVKKSIEDLDIPLQILDNPQSISLVPEKGKITFNQVSFSYPEASLLFEDLSLEIQPNQKVGLVGYSGGGKSTFVNLLLRLFELDKGKIEIDDQNIKLITQNSLRKNITFIPQEPSLFHRTLMENIRYGNLEATEEQVIKAAKQAHAHEFIDKLPNKYESLVGERGIKLSGGQRQRIAIARAILKNAPILILDEATSQLDSLTEQKIQETLLEFMQLKTTLVIAHRLSTLLHMDRILVFEKGKIIEDGSHSELLAYNGLYKTLWEAQIGGFLPQTP